MPTGSIKPDASVSRDGLYREMHKIAWIKHRFLCRRHAVWISNSLSPLCRFPFLIVRNRRASRFRPPHRKSEPLATGVGMEIDNLVLPESCMRIHEWKLLSRTKFRLKDSRLKMLSKTDINGL